MVYTPTTKDSLQRDMDNGILLDKVDESTHAQVNDNDNHYWCVSHQNEYDDSQGGFQQQDDG
jgi:hypothetical protein